jgi:hypothetical protein
VSAQDNLSQQLFHASDVEFRPGDVVTPRNHNHAYASIDPNHAGQWGKNVYKVEPVDAKEMHETTKANHAWLKNVDWNPEDSEDMHRVRNFVATVNSKSGFKVVGKA